MRLEIERTQLGRARERVRKPNALDVRAVDD